MKLLASQPLGRKIFILTVLGLIMGLSIFSTLSMRAVNQVTDTMLQERLTTGQLVADYLDETLGNALNELQNTAQSIHGNDSSSTLSEQVSDLEEAYLRLSIVIHSVYLVNSSGDIIWCEPQSNEVVGSNLSFCTGWGFTSGMSEATITGLVTAPIDKSPTVLFACPVTEVPTDKGILVVAIEPAQSNIGGLIRPLRLGQTGYVEIVDQNGLVVARTGPGPELSPFEKSDHSGRFTTLIEEGKPAQGLCHTCHEPMLTVERRDVLAFAPLSTIRWGVVIRQSEEEALAPIRELRQNLLLFGFILAGIALLITTATTRDAVNRLKRLTAAAHRIAGGDLVNPISSKETDEIGVLTGTFEHMRSRLRESYGALEQRTRELASLLSVSEIFSRLPDLSDLDIALNSALDKTLEIMNEDTGCILLMDEEKGKLCYRVQHNFFSENETPSSQPLDEGLIGRVAQAGKTALFEKSDFSQTYLSGLSGLACIPLQSKKGVLGVLVIGSRKVSKFPPGDAILLEGIARIIAAGIENMLLHNEVQQKEQLRGELLRDMFSIQEEERKRIARELHDETCQTLASLSANLEASVCMLPANSGEAVKVLRKAQDMAIRTLGDMHRLIYELRPSLLDDLGLIPATRWLLDNHLKKGGVKTSVEIIGRETRLPTRIETTLFRVIQESINNIARHAEATKVSVSIHYTRSRVTVSIKDNGKGFNVKEALSSKSRPRGLGLLGMTERIELLQGVSKIQSKPKSGTKIDIRIPLRQEVTDEQDKNTHC